MASRTVMVCGVFVVVLKMFVRLDQFVLLTLLAATTEYVKSVAFVFRK